jgi:hypothetical protein
MVLNQHPTLLKLTKSRTLKHIHIPKTTKLDIETYTQILERDALGINASNTKLRRKKEKCWKLGTLFTMDRVQINNYAKLVFCNKLLTNNI